MTSTLMSSMQDLLTTSSVFPLKSAITEELKQACIL
jgi:hypothetical protein